MTYMIYIILEKQKLLILTNYTVNSFREKKEIRETKEGRDTRMK